MIPGINHPVFKDKPVNYDPREVWVRDLFTQRSEYNAFHEYYRALVEALYKAAAAQLAVHTPVRTGPSPRFPCLRFPDYKPLAKTAKRPNQGRFVQLKSRLKS
jgi:hypothetical protein